MRLKLLLTITFLFCGLLLPPAISDNFAPAKAGDSRPVSLDAKDSDIRDLLIGLAKASGINLIIGDSVQGKVTISLSGVSSMEAIELILQANGFSAEKVGNSVIAAKPEELRNFTPRVSKVISLQNAEAVELLRPLSGIVGNRVEIQADPRTNSIIAVGTLPDIQRFEETVKLLDIEISPLPKSPVETKVFPLKYTQASKLQGLVSQFCSSAGRVSADERTNSLIVTDEESAIEKMAELIDHLDVETQKDIEQAQELQTQVFNLNHIDANAIKDILGEMLSPRGKIYVLHRQKGTISPVQPRDTGALGGEQASVSTTTSRSTDQQKWSDTLIVTDIPDVCAKIGELIGKLDTKPSQVKIEAKLVEVSLSDIQDLGIDWQALHSKSDSYLKTESFSGIIGGLDVKVGMLSAQSFEDIMFRLRALETRGKVKLISNPSIITLDNELAQIIVADKIPVQRTFETEFRSTTGYEFINVGVSLIVTPHITEDGYIIMDTMPEVESIKQWTSGENPQPIISSRSAHTRVRVKDGQTFVIGGLIEDKKINTSARVPLLGRIPLLGHLFGTTSVDSAKTDLIVFITPKICEEGL